MLLHFALEAICQSVPPVHLTNSFAAAPNAHSKPKPANHVRAEGVSQWQTSRARRSATSPTRSPRQRNRAIKSELKTAIRAAREAVAAGDATAAYAKGLYACRLLDKAVSKGVIHKNQAANRKSGVMALVNTIVTDEVRAAYVKPEAKKQEATGSKKAARKAEKAAAYKAAAEEKAKRVAEQQKLEAAAAERKAKEAAEAAAAEAAAEAEAAEGEEAAE